MALGIGERGDVADVRGVSAGPVVGFEVGGRRFALPARIVERLLRAAALTPLPGAPDVVAGVLNLAGEPVPVLDLRRRFGLPRKALAPSDFLILTRAAARRIAIRAERVSGVETLAREGLHPPGVVASMAPQIAGVAVLRDDLVLLHDPDAFLTAAEDAQLEAALAAASPS